MVKIPGFEVEEGDTEHISFSGRRVRRKTVLIKVGRRSLSRKAAILGAALIICQLLDGLLTYIGLSAMGIQMEGNALLRNMMEFYGKTPVLFFSKLAAILFIVMLTFQAHQRRWIRPIIFLLILTYVLLAVGPWAYIIITKKPLSIFPGMGLHHEGGAL